MGFKLITCVLAYSFICITYSHSAIVSHFNVMDYGAKRDGKTDDSKAFMNTWKRACNNPNKASTMVIPAGNYNLGPVEFPGPCKPVMTVQVHGHIQAPSSVDAFKLQHVWIHFKNINGLTVLRGGTFDGQGMIAWKKSKCAKSGKCNMPANIGFTGVTNGEVKQITSLDSKMFHINILSCNNMNINNITIKAPETSLNTDGVHIGRSSMINITSSTIKTGDDCVSLGDGSQHINVNNVTCGPGHGISVGSLGLYPKELPVVGVTVRNCTLVNTQNGVRIKTWTNSFGGIASGLHFEDIIMDNVSNPVLIDQDYCPDNLCKLRVPSKVKVTDVLFKDIRGSSATEMAIQLRCSKQVPCRNVKLIDIELKYNNMSNKKKSHTTTTTTTSQCSNVRPTILGKLLPPPCLTP